MLLGVLPTVSPLQIDAGRYHTCGIDVTNALHCWGVSDEGSDDYGQVSKVPVNGSWSQVSAGSMHSCAIDMDGVVHCWGSEGQSKVDDIPEETFVWISAGHHNTCGVNESGVVFC